VRLGSAASVPGALGRARADVVGRVVRLIGAQLQHVHITPDEEAVHPVSGAVPIRQRFRELWQTGPDGGRQWQDKTGTFQRLCWPGWFRLAHGGALVQNLSNQ
jgi:hypothetical protein